MNYRVVVTGLGQISPIGNDVRVAWENLKHGRSGIGPITRFDTHDFTTKFAGEVKNFDAGSYLTHKEIRQLDKFMHYGIAAGIQAMTDGGFDRDKEANSQFVSERFGVIVGSGIGGLPRIESTHINFLEKGARRIDPFFVPASISNMVAGLLSIKYQLCGPNFSIASACASGTHSIGEAMRLIRHGEADLMLAGGAESAVSPLGIGGFGAARTLSTRNNSPETASRPWDKDRDGFVLGEGAGILLLEEYQHAKRRGAHIYCELLGYGRNADAYHITTPAVSGLGATRCMLLALRDAGLEPQDIHYLNAHGTSTQIGDVVEAEAIQSVFAQHINSLVISSTKSMTGHLLGAAGGVEAVYTILAMMNNLIPPTINLDNQDQLCQLDFCPHYAKEMYVNVAMSNSFGFGGTNASLIFKKLHQM